jgi:hypothetical protein
VSAEIFVLQGVWVMKIISAVCLIALITLTACDDRSEQHHSAGQAASQRPAPLARDDKPFRPLKQNECIETAMIGIYPRLEQVCTLGKAGEVAHFPSSQGRGIRDCGITVDYAFGDIQKAYDTNLEVKDNWRIGDPIKICRVDKPPECPPGRYYPGAEYLATNLRTKTSWQERNRLYGTECEELESE